MYNKYNKACETSDNMRTQTVKNYNVGMAR